MASAAASILVVMSTLIGTATAPDAERCRGVEAIIQRIDMSLLKGVWYESHSFGMLPVVGPRICHSAHIYPAEDAQSMHVLHDYAYYVGNQPQTAKFGWKVIDEDLTVDNGKFAVEMALHFSEWMKATFLVVDTDYSNYIIIYVCKSLDGFKFNGGMILTRKKLQDDDESNAVRSLIDASYKKNFMSKSEFVPTAQAKCKDPVFPEVFPASVVPIGKPATAAYDHVNAKKPEIQPKPKPKPPPSPQEIPPPPPPELNQPLPQPLDTPLHGVSMWAEQNSLTNPERLLSRVIHELEKKAGLLSNSAAPAPAPVPLLKPLGPTFVNGDYTVPNRLLSRVINQLEKKGGFFTDSSSSGAGSHTSEPTRPTGSTGSTGSLGYTGTSWSSTNTWSSSQIVPGGGFLSGLIGRLEQATGLPSPLPSTSFSLQPYWFRPPPPPPPSPWSTWAGSWVK